MNQTHCYEAVEAEQTVSAPLPNLRSLATEVLRSDAETLRRVERVTERSWHAELRRTQGHLRLLRPVVETGWNLRHRELLRRANTALTDLGTLAHLDDRLETDAFSAQLREARARTQFELDTVVHSDAWTEMVEVFGAGEWPWRAGRFRHDVAAAEFVPGQIRPLFRKLDRLRQSTDDASMRLVAKTTARLAAGLELLERAGVDRAVGPLGLCHEVLDRLAPAVLHSRAIELAAELQVAEITDRLIAPASTSWNRAVQTLLDDRALGRTPTWAEPVRAAGAVVWRRHEGRLEVVLVSRHRQLDWSLPKGKCAAHESFVECALRETHEETGLRCVVGEELLDATYRDRAGRPKLVRYWSARPVGGELGAAHEIAEVAWFDLQTAMKRVTKRHEAEVLASLCVVAESVE